MVARFGMIRFAIVVAVGFGLATPDWSDVRAEELPPAAEAATGDSDEQRNKAILVANLAEYGYKHSDALALLSAANILASMDVSVTKRDGSHDSEANDHGINGLFDADAMVQKALLLAEDYPEEDASSIGRIAQQLSEGSKGYMGFLHTHYVWWCCDYWGNWYYRWVSHH